MVTSLTLSSPGGTLDLEMGDEFAALIGASGFGRPAVTTRWSEGAGHGARYRSTRVQRRVSQIPVLVRGDDLTDTLSKVMRVIDPINAPARLSVAHGSENWWLDVVCTAGGDYQYGRDTNGAGWLQIALTLEAGQPFWTRQDAVVLPIRPGGLGRGLLGTGRSLTMLRLSSSQAIGSVVLENPGDAESFPEVVIGGPATSLVSANDRGDTLLWSGSLTAGQRRVFDHAEGRLYDPDRLGDPDGGNRYNELGPAPRFWSIPPFTTTARLELLGVTSESYVEVRYRPRRWAVV